ncbi:MAG TPA: NAD(P)-binding protein [Kofleriaceae bacterium]
MQVTVVGAGVTGLVTALTLEEAGHDVQVVAAATGEAITSSVADPTTTATAAPATPCAAAAPRPSSPCSSYSLR